MSSSGRTLNYKVYRDGTGKVRSEQTTTIFLESDQAVEKVLERVRLNIARTEQQIGELGEMLQSMRQEEEALESYLKSISR